MAVGSSTTLKAITHRKNGIFQYATIGCGHPWYTDNMLQLPAMEADLFGALKDSALDVLDVRADPAGLSNIAYAKIRWRCQAGALRNAGIVENGDPEGRLCFR